MRIAAYYTIPQVRLEKPERGLRDYLRISLEKVFSDAVDLGVVDDELRELYVSAVETLQRGSLPAFRRLLNELREKIEERRTRRISFNYSPPCFDCAIVSMSEGEFMYKLIGDPSRFYKVFYGYDRFGKLRFAGGLVKLEALEDAFQRSFLAVA